MMSTTQWLTTKITDFFNIFPEWMRTSPLQLIYKNTFLSMNYVLQSFLFCKSILSLIGSIFLFFGVIQVSNFIESKPVYVCLAILFICTHVSAFSDNHQVIHDCLKLICGLYVSLYAVEGCCYVKDHIEAGKNQSQIIINNIKSLNVVQLKKKLHQKSLSKQISLIMITLLTACFFFFVFYQVKISQSLPSLSGNNQILTLLIICTVVIHLVSLIKNISLFLSAMICFFCIYGTLFIRILLQLSVYPHSPQLRNLNLPWQSFFIIILSIQGKQKHIRQCLNNIAIEYRDATDVHHIEQLKQAKRMQISSTFKAAACYYLYTVTHGYQFNIEYLIVPAFAWLALRGSLK